MEYLKSLFGQLKAPFPYSRGLREEVFAVIRVSIFASLLILILRPFGLATAPYSTLIGYWLVSMIVAVLNLLLFNLVVSKWVNEIKWTVGKEIVRTLYYLLSIAMGIMLYTMFRIQGDFQSSDVLIFSLYTVLIGFIPVSIRVISIHNWLLKRNLSEANQLNSFLTQEESVEEVKLIKLESEELNESFETTNQQLLYLESEQHYVKIYYLDKQVVKSSMIRLGLKKAINQIDDQHIKQCHRSYLVNLRMVDRVKSNSQGIKVCLLHDDVTLPVSRTFKKAITEALKKLNN